MSADEPTLTQAEREREFPLTAEQIYLNTATQGPLPTTTVGAIERGARQAQYPERAGVREALKEADTARALLARMFGATEDDFSFTPNTTHGLNICARGIEWRPGDNVVLPAREFPSVLRTWLQLRDLGVEVRLVPPDGIGTSAGALMSAVDARTRAVSCSAVAWDTGYRVELEELGRRCAGAGCLLIVDGIQAAGAVELDLRALRVSAFAMHGYKWLLSGFGCGALYVAPEAVDRIRPRFVGEQAFEAGAAPDDLDVPWQPGARRYAAGGPNALGLAAMAASLGLIERIGLPVIAAHNRRLGQLLVDGLRRHGERVQLVSPADPERRASIVVFTLGNATRDAELVRRLAERGIVVALRRRGVRVSPHLYNTGAEVERLLAALSECQ